MTEKNTILILDDEVDLLTMLKFQLNKKGYHVVTGENGVEGLEKLQTLKPGLIILDVNMPKMGGIEFYNQICDGRNKPRFPIFVLTARANLEQFFKDFEVDGFMSKPFEMDHLLAEIERVLSKKKSLDEAVPRARSFSRDILIADSEQKALNEIALVFLNTGYRVTTAHNGEAAIERINNHLPDIVLVRQELDDIPGETLALRLTKMSRTADIKFVLYTDKVADNLMVLKESRKHSGVEKIVESSRPTELVAAVNECFESDK